MPEHAADFYGLPTAYDILYSVSTAAELDGLGQIARRFGIDPGRAAWLEPACGTGRFLRLLARRSRVKPGSAAKPAPRARRGSSGGFRGEFRGGFPGGFRGCAVGFDRHPDMIAYARARLASTGAASRRVIAVEADMTSFNDTVRRSEPARRVLGRRAGGLGGRKSVSGWADFAFNVHNTIRHLPTDDALVAHLDEMARALSRGGLYAVGMHLAAYGLEGPTEDVWSASRGRCRVSCVAQSIPPGTRGATARRELIVGHLTLTTPSRQQHHDFAYPLRTFSREEWEACLARSGLRCIAEVDEQGRDLPGPERRVIAPGYGIFVLTHASGSATARGSARIGSQRRRAPSGSRAGSRKSSRHRRKSA